MNRKQFIESLGATCDNWNWSWSFINKKNKTIIFGAWDIFDDGNMSLIFSDKWKLSEKGRKSNGYSQSREHIRLIEEEGYRLLTFSMEYSEKLKDVNGLGPAKIGKVEPIAKQKALIRIGNDWFASDEKFSVRIAEELPRKCQYIEGASKIINVNAYERNEKARLACLSHYGYTCKVCGFNFEKAYGLIGKNFIHVHHVLPISQIKKEYSIDPIKDLIPVCPNCHAMIHKTEPPLTVAVLRKQISDILKQ